MLAETARRKGLALHDGDRRRICRKRVVLDGRHLRQVLLNLLGNAIKFTAEGRGARSTIAARTSGRLTFAVTDTGPGSSPRRLAEIFDAFTQTEAGAAAGGTGLGLTISRHLLTHHGSRAERGERTLGEGSRFFFALPLVPATMPRRRMRADA